MATLKGTTINGNLTVTGTTTLTGNVSGDGLSAGKNDTRNKIVNVGGDSVAKIGMYLDFHYNNSNGNGMKYSTRLYPTNESGTANSIKLPASSGTMALTSDIPTKVSALTNDSGYLTSHQSLSYGSIPTVLYTSDTSSDLITATFGSSTGSGVRVIRTDTTAPGGLLGENASGLFWKNTSDTYGALTVGYANGHACIAGGNYSGNGTLKWSASLAHSNNTGLTKFSGSTYATTIKILGTSLTFNLSGNTLSIT